MTICCFYRCISSSASQLRHRGAGGGADGKSPNSSSSMKKTSDPLRWFGVLVPMALRQAQVWMKGCRNSAKMVKGEFSTVTQATFKKAAESAVDAANAAAEIR